MSGLVHGTTRVLSHCNFEWFERVIDPRRRTYEVGPHHCSACIEALRKRWPEAELVATGAFGAMPPLEQPPAYRPTDELFERGEAASILIVEDSADERESRRALLERAGYRVVSARSARSALQRLIERDPPRLIVVDLDLPYTNGVELLKLIRRQKAYSRIPVIALGMTPSSRPGIYDSFLYKPVDPKGLLDLISCYLDSPIDTISSPFESTPR